MRSHASGHAGVAEIGIYEVVCQGDDYFPDTLDALVNRSLQSLLASLMSFRTHLTLMRPIVRVIKDHGSLRTVDGHPTCF